MEDISILHPDNSERSIAFKFTNTTDTDKDVYIKDVTLYSFLRNIDWVNNVFSWVELRDIPMDKLVCNPPSENPAPDYITNGEMQVPLLCCLRIPPGTYKNTESIIAMINTKLGELKGYGLAINGIQAIHNIPACAYDIGDIAIKETGTSWYPAIIDSPVVINNFDISLDNTNSNPLTRNACIPVLEHNAEPKSLSLPLEGSLNYNNLSLYNSDLISKMGSSSLTSHAVSFINSITNTLTIDKIVININDLYASEYGLIRYRENANDYTEYIINPFNQDLINEITAKYGAIKPFSLPLEEGVISEYPELNTEGNYRIFSCNAYPFFPVSTKLYLYNCNTPYIDKVIESQVSTERLFGISLASMEVDSRWTNQQQTTAETAAHPYGLARGTLSTERGAAETLDIVTSVKPHTVSVNSIINIPSGSTTSIYVIGDNQRYPLWRSSHSLTYRVIN